MTLDTEGQAPTTTPETSAPAPAPEAKAPETPDVFKEELSEREQLDQAERAELSKVYRRMQADRQAEPEEEEKPSATRDPKTGKFTSALKEEVQTGDDEKPISGKQKPNSAEADPKSAEKKDSEPKPEPKAEEAKKPAVEAPKHWSDKQKAALSKLDPDEQEAFIKDATEARQHLSRQGNALKAYEPIGRILTEHKPAFDRYGLNYEQGLKTLLDTNAALEDPNTVQEAYYKLGAKLSKIHGFDVGMASQAEPEDQDWVDPNILQLRQELEASRREAQESRQQLNQLLQDQKTQAAGGLVNQFFQGKDEELTDEIADQLSVRIRMLQAVYPNAPQDQVLARAWHEVVTLDPARQEKLIAEKQREQAAKVEQARRAAALAVQSEPDPSTATSERDMMRRIYRKNHAA
jgi:hypothetical protein